MGLFLAILIATLSLSCDVVMPAKPDVYYKRDAIIRYAGQEYVGIAILPEAASYSLEFSFAASLDLFTLRTCHREITQDEFGSRGIFNRKQNKVSINYVPQPGLEADNYCPIEVGGYAAESGRHSWAFIDFESDREKLSALVKCNGERRVYPSVSACQSLMGLIQELVFHGPVKFSPTDSECASPETTDNKTFRIYAPKGRCVYAFRELEGEKRYHRFTSIGYESILIRKAL